MWQQTHDLEEFKVIMIGKHQSQKQRQEQIGPTCIAQIWESIRNQNGQSDENQAIHQDIGSEKQQRNSKNRQDDGHGNLGPYRHGFLEIGIASSKKKEYGWQNKND